MTITKAQNGQLHYFLNHTKMIAHKADLVLAFTEGRSASSREMTAQEAMLLINYLKELDNTSEACNNMRRKVLSMCHRIHWVTEKGVDIDRLNEWCKKSSYLKKELNEYTYQELPKLVSQFRIVYLHYIQSTSK